MAIPIFTAKLSEKIVINDKYIKLHFELIQPHRFDFIAGQYILLTVPGTLQKKSYSITSIPEMDHGIELLVDISPGGVGSTYLNHLKLGESIEFRGPVGHFIASDKPEEERFVFVATGSGISPIRSIILDQLISQKTNKPISLFWGLRKVENIFWQEDFYQLTQEHPLFSFEIILSQPPQTGWDLSTGYVTDLLAERIIEYDKTGYYLCGNKIMIDNCRQLLTEKQVDFDRIHFEKFY